MNKFIRDLVKSINDEHTSVAEDGLSSAEFTGYIDTGSYLFNAQLSGTIFGGLPNTKNLVLAGEQAVGKTFLALGIVNNFLKKDDRAFVVWYLAEPAVTKSMLVERGIDPSRVMFAEPVTVHQWAQHVLKTTEAYMETPKEDRPPMLIVLDSLGQLSTEKEIKDLSEGNDKKDMTRNMHIRGTFRAIALQVARAKTPIIITNHVYEVIGSYVPTKEVAGGGGAKYASDIIAVLSSSKKRDDDKVVVGNTIKSYMYKSRYSRQFTTTELDLSFYTGLSRYHGLLELGEDGGIFKKENRGKLGTWWNLSETVKAPLKKILQNPEEYFTDEVLAKLDVVARKKFEYGKKEDLETETDAENNTNDSM